MTPSADGRPTEHVADVEREGRALVASARTAGYAAPVPTCPDWDVRALVKHVTRVLQRTTVLVGEAHEDLPPRELWADVPTDDTAIDHLDDVVTTLVATLGAADPATPCWNFTGHDTVAAFWMRRMANELTVHRVDADRAAGGGTPVQPDRGVDGVDELLTVLLPYVAGRIEAPPDAGFHLHATDADGEWLTVFRDGVPTTTREHAKGDLAVRGPAGSLLLWANNRMAIGDGGLESFGDPALAAAWGRITF